MRILITGSQTWEDEAKIREVLEQWSGHMGDELILVSGHCPKGADAICEKIAEEYGWTVEPHPADWMRYGKRAGYVRDAQMVSLGADLCIAFIHYGSPGASATANMALKAHIPLVVHPQFTAVRLHTAGMKDEKGTTSDERDD